MAKIYLGTIEITKAYLGSSALDKLDIGGEDILFEDNTPKVWTIIDTQNSIPVKIGIANMGDVLIRRMSNYQVRITLPSSEDGLINLELLDPGGGSAGFETSFKSIGATVDWTQLIGTTCKITRSAELELTIEIL